MKKHTWFLTFSMIFLLCIWSVSVIYADYKEVNVGKYHEKIVDSGDQSAAAISGGRQNRGLYYYNDFIRGFGFRNGLQLGCENWTDENQNHFQVKISGYGFAGSGYSTDAQVPVPDENGVYIHRYYRSIPPTVTVDNIPLNEPFPFDDGDHVSPDKIPGTADEMVESWFNLDMGVTAHQRVLAWDQKNHDDYIIQEITFKNTGNTDQDPEIELEGQTLTNFYILRMTRLDPFHPSWASAYGQKPGDSLRITYMYPYRGKNASFDLFGDVQPNGLIRYPIYVGEAYLHVDKSAKDHSDDVTQPHMTGTMNSETTWSRNASSLLSAGERDLLYTSMTDGFQPILGTPYLSGRYPGTHHSVPTDQMGVQYLDDFDWFAYDNVNMASFGPYTLEFGDSVTIIMASYVFGSISPEEGWNLGQDWEAGTITPPPGNTMAGPNNLPPQYQQYPELYATDSRASAESNFAKDSWIMTGKDSLFQNAYNAQWNVKHDYNVPVPPPPPSVEVHSLPDKIEVKWGDESEAASDFAGYRVYRAIGNPGTVVQEDKLVGTWEKVFECGEGTSQSLTHVFEDAQAQRGQGYYYYVSAFDDGQGNTGVDGKDVGVLETGPYRNRTTRSASLTRAPGESLSEIRVVPNPFHISASDVQFTGEPNKIIFMGLPPEATIKIYSESGDMVQVIEHTDGSGDEAWGDIFEEQQVTRSGQVVVSGVYIALIQTPSGESTYVKFAIVR